MSGNALAGNRRRQSLKSSAHWPFRGDPGMGTMGSRRGIAGSVPELLQLRSPEVVRLRAELADHLGIAAGLRLFDHLIDCFLTEEHDGALDALHGTGAVKANRPRA